MVDIDTAHPAAPPLPLSSDLVVFQGDEDLFAVPGSMAWFGTGSAVADTLTLLPPGRDWLWRALLCSETLTKEDLPADHDLTEEQVRLYPPVVLSWIVTYN